MLLYWLHRGGGEDDSLRLELLGFKSVWAKGPLGPPPLGPSGRNKTQTDAKCQLKASDFPSAQEQFKQSLEHEPSRRPKDADADLRMFREPPPDDWRRYALEGLQRGGPPP